MSSKRPASLAYRYLANAMRLRCPVCGVSPVFVPWYKVRSSRDWFTPLDGCPRCGYAYEREPGYFLMAVWAVNYGFGSVVGISLYVLLESNFDLPIFQLLALVLTPVALFNILFARHSKTLFLAVDHFFDPHEKEGGDDRGNLPNNPPPPDQTPPNHALPSPSGAPSGSDQGSEPCEAGSPMR